MKDRIFTAARLVILLAITSHAKGLDCQDPFTYVGGSCLWLYQNDDWFEMGTPERLCEEANSRLFRFSSPSLLQTLTEWILSPHNDGNVFYLTGMTEYEIQQLSLGMMQVDPVIATPVENGLFQPFNSKNANAFICEKLTSRSKCEGSCLLTLVLISSCKFHYRRHSLTGNTDDSEPLCVPHRVEYVPDPDNCHGYILCFGKDVFKFQCRGSDVFDPITSSCKDTSANTDCFVDYYDGDYDYSDEYSEEIGNVQEKPPRPSKQQYSNYICEDPTYNKIKNKCYKVFADTVNWKRAKELCIGNEQADLAMIKDKHTQRMLRKYTNNSSKKVFAFWIGLNDAQTKNRYVWSDKSVLQESDYQNWRKNARRRWKNLERCIEISMFYKSRWNDQDCLSENGYICEKDAVNTNSQLRIAGSRSLVPVGQVATKMSPSSFCGTNARPDKPAPVVGGTIANEPQHPWQVSLRNNGQHRCGGSLIDSCWVLTAAHCVDSRITRPENLPHLAVLGDFDTKKMTGEEQYLRVSRFTLHPDWEASPVPTNDIALIKLSDCAVNVNPVCLPAGENLQFRAEDSCKVAGWGSENPQSPKFSTVLKEAIVPIIPQQKCRQLYQRGGDTVIRQTMFCAGYLEGGTDACQGDSGGPITCRGIVSSRAVQKGIVSWGLGCAEKNRPGIYTRVSSYMGWISNETNINFLTEYY